MSNTTRTRRATLPMLAIAGALTVAACSTTTATDPAPTTTTTSTTPVDDARPTSLTCRGVGTEEGAQITYRAETVIDAPLSTIWDLQTDVDKWPTWQQPVTSMEHAPGPLGAGSQFTWTTPAPATAVTPATTLVITSTIGQLEPQSCIQWSGPAIGDGLTIDNGVHVWNFNEIDGGVLVSTEESWSGPQVEADVTTSTMFLGAGLDAWLSDLKTTAEARS